MSPYSWALPAEVLMLVPPLAIPYWLVLQRFRATRWRIACFVGAVALVVTAFVTPLQTLALNYLLTAHLLQNVVLAEWAPALVVLALPPAFAAAAGRIAALRVATHPLVALPVWLGVYFAWHVPAIYDSALRHPATLLHVEHLSYFVAGLLLWWPVFQEHPHALPFGARAAYVFAAFVFASPLGLLLALLPHPVYDVYAQAPEIWGISHTTDQAIAGITMASEEAIVFFTAFAVYFARFLREQERPGDELAPALDET